MYVVAVIVLGMYGMMFFLSRKEVIDWQTEALLKPFYRMALYLFKKRCAGKKGYSSKSRVKRDLELLHPGEAKEQLYTVYYVKKTGLSLLICFLGTLLGLVVSIKSVAGVVLTKEGTIQRTSYWEGAQSVLLETKADTGNNLSFEITVEPMDMSEEEFLDKREEFHRKLEQVILNRNPSLWEVSTDLNLSESFEGFPFLVEWKNDRPDVIGSSGKVWEVCEKQMVNLQAVVSYGSRQWEETVEVCVVPPVLSAEEQVQKQLQELLQISEENSRREKAWKLPDTYGETSIVWKQAVENHGLLLWGLAILVSVVVFLLSDRDLHSLLLKRRASMKREYADVVHTLVLYLGAGMTIRGAFLRMSSDKEDEERTPIYEEILYTCRELHAGVSEGSAYEHFGKRTGLQEYIRLSTLLTQNLKKGNATLLQRLKEEAAKASAERMQSVRKLSEEAGTKLLVPMVMMLGAVMLMIMIPAFSAMGV